MHASADTTVAFEERLVILTDRTFDEITFSEVSAVDAANLKDIVLGAMPPERPMTISLDRIVAGMDVDKVNVRRTDVNLAPPQIFVSESEAVLVMFLGKPRFKPVAEGHDLMFAVNTNWDVLLDSTSSKYYLLNDRSWLMTDDVAAGAWTPVSSLPKSFGKLPLDENWSDVRAAIPGESARSIPQIFVSFEPAELIVTHGKPEFEPIPGTKLMLVTNTENDLFFHMTNKKYYVLAAGRWFSASSIGGPWLIASDALPDDFKNIPEDSDAGEVLAAVPGTDQANEAVIMASIPQIATVNRTEVTVNVSYDGEPQFKPIETTKVQYAYNTPFNVFLVDGRYYCCHNGFWFVAPTPNGVWTICDSVPVAIYSIPPSSPKYNVTYVTVYESTPQTVTCGYTSGYNGATVAATGVVMFGLGMVVGAAIADDDDCCWHYHYHSCWFSYGSGAIWHSSHGGYICAGHRYGPYGGAGRWAAYNPYTGVYSRGGFAYGPRGAAGYRAAYNPSTGMAGARIGGTSPYGSWGRGIISNGDEWVRTGYRSGARGTVAGARTSEDSGVVHAQGRWGNGGTIARTDDGDVYAGKDGKVYKRSDDGWEQMNNSRRDNAGQNSSRDQNSRPKATAVQSHPPHTAGNLQREAKSRDRGERNVERSRTTRAGRERRPPSRNRTR